MELQEVAILIIATLAAIGGLVLVLLQKKGIIKPILTQTRNGFNFISGGTILLFAIVIGACTLFHYSKIVSVLYVVLLTSIYIFIQKLK